MKINKHRIVKHRENSKTPRVLSKAHHAVRVSEVEQLLHSGKRKHHVHSG